jgi:hypothetical protein
MTRWLSDDFLSAANDGLDELSEATKFYERFASIPLMGGQTYYDLRGLLPADVVSINSVFNVNEQIWLGPRGIADMITPRWETVAGSPQEYLTRGLYWLGLYPRPAGDTGVIRVFYSGLAPHFRDSSSVLSDLPDDYAAALDDYIMYDLSCKDGESEKALSYWGTYLNREESLKRFVDGRITTSRTGHLSHRRAM